jgi:hypothetical protein
MASVSGSQLTFLSPNHEAVNLILNDGKTVSGATVAGAFNIEIFTVSAGTPLPGVDATAFIEGAVKVSDSSVQAASLDSVEQLGSGAFTVIDNTGKQSLSHHEAPQGETIELGTGAQTVIGSSGDTIVGGDAGTGRQVIDLTGRDHRVTDGPMTAIGGAGALLVKAGDADSITGGGGPLTVIAATADTITGGSGPTSVFGGGPASRRGFHEDEDEARLGTTGRYGGNTIIGGSGPMTVYGGKLDSITGGSGDLTVVENPGASGAGQTIIGGSGDLTVFGFGTDELIVGGSGTNFIEGEITGGPSSIVGGTGTVTGAGGQAVNTLIITDKGDTVTGSSGSMSVEGGSGDAMIVAGTGGTTVEGGKGNVIDNSGSGTLLVELNSQSTSPTVASALQGSGAETVDLGAGHGATTLRDVSVAGGTGPLAETTVTGFATTTDTIASATSVSPTGTFLGSSETSDGNTVLSFIDGSTMTLVGITDISKLTFTQ